MALDITPPPTERRRPGTRQSFMVRVNLPWDIFEEFERDIVRWTIPASALTTMIVVRHYEQRRAAEKRPEPETTPPSPDAA